MASRVHAVAFHSKHGKKVLLSENGRVAHRAEGVYNGVVFTERPIPLDTLFQVELLEVDRAHKIKLLGRNYGLKIGITTACPDDNPVPENVGTLYFRDDYWILSERTVHHSKKRKSLTKELNVEKLIVGQSAGCLVTKDGVLHFHVNSKEGVGWTGLPTDKPIWGFVDVYGQAKSIRLSVFAQDPLSEDPTPMPHPPMIDSISKEPAASISSTKPAVPVSTSKEPVVIPMKDLELKEAIGEGAFGVVRKGYWTSSDGSKHLVAIKQLKGVDKNEVKILSALDHPNIITLYGTSEYNGLQYIVTEIVEYGGQYLTQCICETLKTSAGHAIVDYAENGSLQDFISKQPCTPDLKRTLPWAKQVADGMLYLHHRGIAHRDLKSNNVVLTSNWVAKICDLGTARTLDHTTRMTSVGTMAWIAPEIIMKKPASKMCDVYSYGILLWEVATHDEPFKDLLTSLFIPTEVVKGVRPVIPESTDVALKELIENCWQTKPEDRPVFESILYSLEECEIGKMEYGELEFTERVGSGGFGTVFKGFWNTKKAGKLLVAIKNTTVVDETEVKVLSSLRHPNFIHFYGYATKIPNHCLVTEFAENGSVAGYIKARKGKPEKEQALKWAKEIAEGMQYLHERIFAHRDLKSDNVLLASDWTAKICDMGSARKLKTTVKQTAITGTWAWIAPEILREEPASKKCDVYSYAILLWELVSFQVPFEGVADIAILMSVAKGERPPIPSDCDPFFSDLIKQCWVDNYKDRPSFHDIMEAWQQ